MSRGFLARLPDGAVLDEIQRAPELTSWLQPLVDEDPRPGRFVLTGSEDLTVTAATSQSLAGRSAVVHLLPLDREETCRTPAGGDDLFTTLWRGGYPALFDRSVPPPAWIGAYVANYVERDVRQLLRIGDLVAFQAFLGLCAGRSASLLNLSSLGGDAGISHVTARAWISALEASYLAFRFPPWHANLGKRLVKSPKLFLWDSGVLCWLLGISEPAQLERHPLRGAVFETWVVGELAKQDIHRARVPRMWFYRDQRGNEVDALVERDGRMLAIEVKSGRTVANEFLDPLKAFRTAWGSRSPEVRPVVVYGGDDDQVRSEGEVVSWRHIDRLSPAP